MSVGRRIRESRMNKGYTQEYVSLQLNVSRQAVSKWEKNLSLPDTRNLMALANLLGVSVEYLLDTPRQMGNQARYRTAVFISRIATFLLFLGFVLYGIGLFSGEFNSHVTVFRIGIPFFYYGNSVTAVVLLAISSLCTLFSILFYCISKHLKKEIG